jgi:transketolase
MTKIQLNKKIFDQDVEQLPIRKGFGEGLVLAAESNDKIVGLCADLTESTQMHLFKGKFPTRFVEMGIAEQNMASVASGFAAMGKLPFMTSYAMFSPGRNWEQIRTTICYNDRKVIIAGSHAGISVGPDGGTHQAIEDIAITRVIPNMIVISPCDAIEARKATLAAADDAIKSPVYLRLAREKTPVITDETTPFEIGKAQVFFEPNLALLKKESIDVGIIATGALVYKAIMVAREFEKTGVAVRVLNLSTIKPLDGVAISNLANEAGAIVTVEEHQIAGGVCSAVSEYLSANSVGSKPAVPIEFIGVKDKFGQSGTPDELIEHYEMGVSHIKNAVEKVMKRK